MKKIVALVLGLAMALSLCTVAFAGGYDTEVTLKGSNEKFADLKYYPQTNTTLGHYEDRNRNMYVETENESLIENTPGVVCFWRDGKVVYLLPVGVRDFELDDPIEETTPAPETAPAPNQSTDNSGSNDKTPAGGNDASKDTGANEPDDKIDVDGEFDDLVTVREAIVFGVQGWDPNARVVPSGHMMVLVKGNVEYKAPASGKTVKGVNEYKCDFCDRTFYGSNYEYSTPESATVSTGEYARKVVEAGFVNAESGVVLGDATFYWTSDADTVRAGSVSSAKTFDAGAAMYVGMGLLAAAGGAAVIGKKKEF